MGATGWSGSVSPSSLPRAISRCLGGTVGPESGCVVSVLPGAGESPVGAEPELDCAADAGVERLGAGRGDAGAHGWGREAVAIGEAAREEDEARGDGGEEGCAR